MAFIFCRPLYCNTRMPHVADELVVVAAEPVEVLSVGGVVRASCTSGPGRRAGP